MFTGNKQPVLKSCIISSRALEDLRMEELECALEVWGLEEVGIWEVLMKHHVELHYRKFRFDHIS